MLCHILIDLCKLKQPSGLLGCLYIILIYCSIIWSTDLESKAFQFKIKFGIGGL